MTFGQKLRAARKAKQLTQKGLALMIHAAHNSISNWENDQNHPDPDTIQNLCWALDVTPNYFFLSETDHSDADKKNMDELPPNCFPIHTKQIPLLGTIACGKPILAAENIHDTVNIPEEISADFALQCKGDSMLGARVQIHDGDLVYIRQQDDVDNGTIAAVLINEEATLKRVYKQPNKLILQPENPDFEPMVYIGQELESIRILGKAIAFVSRIE
ncbi:MAG: helix-turn-helix domain-containing protein [Butyricicoccus pullicaecorum]|nr:helix-turn-helix domain-containing protein [Butyricicoccus pullicaecorum]